MDWGMWGRWNHFLFSLNFIITQPDRRVEFYPPSPTPSDIFSLKFSVLSTTLTTPFSIYFASHSSIIHGVFSLSFSSCAYFPFVFHPSFFLLYIYRYHFPFIWLQPQHWNGLPLLHLFHVPFHLVSAHNCVFGFTLKHISSSLPRFT